MQSQEPIWSEYTTLQLLYKLVIDTPPPLNNKTNRERGYIAIALHLVKWFATVVFSIPLCIATVLVYKFCKACEPKETKADYTVPCAENSRFHEPSSTPAPTPVLVELPPHQECAPTEVEQVPKNTSATCAKVVNELSNGILGALNESSVTGLASSNKNDGCSLNYKKPRSTHCANDHINPLHESTRLSERSFNDTKRDNSGITTPPISRVSSTASCESVPTASTSGAQPSPTNAPPSSFHKLSPCTTLVDDNFAQIWANADKIITQLYEVSKSSSSVANRIFVFRNQRTWDMVQSDYYLYKIASSGLQKRAASRTLEVSIYTAAAKTCRDAQQFHLLNCSREELYQSLAEEYSYKATNKLQSLILEALAEITDSAR